MELEKGKNQNLRKTFYGASKKAETSRRHGFYTTQKDNFFNFLFQSLKSKEIWRRIWTLLITAGPLTYIGIHLGYKVLGKVPEFRFILYISIVTLVTGSFTILVEAYRKAQILSVDMVMQEKFKEVLATLLDLIIFSRNAQIAKMDEKDKNLEIAFQILKDPDASTNGIEYAMSIIPNCPPGLGKQVVYIELLRKRGFFSEIQNIAEQIENQEIDFLRSLPLKMQKIIRFRFHGKLPNRRLGQKRIKGFLDKFIEASNIEDFSIVTHSDCEHILRVILELLLKRKFGVLRWNFTNANKVSSLSGEKDIVDLQIRKIHRRKRLKKISKKEFEKKIEIAINKSRKLKDQIEKEFEKNKAPINVDLDIVPLFLDEDQINSIIVKVYRLLDTVYLNPQLGEIVDLEEEGIVNILDLDQQKELVGEIFNLVDHEISFTSMDAVTYIENSPSIQINNIDPSAARSAKIEYLNSAVEDLTINFKPQVEQSFVNMIEKYKVPISDRCIIKLSKKFDIAQERLSSINKKATN